MDILKKKTRLLEAVYACFILCFVNPANATLIDFETVPGDTPSDQLAISTQYLATDGITFSLSDGDTPFLEKTGSDSGVGFINDQMGWEDIEATSHNGELGNYFLRFEKTSFASEPVPVLMISYATPINVASAQIWDIDGVESLGTEQWKISALDNNQVIIDTLLSPLGTANDSTSLDGLPWTWSFNHASNDIYAVELEFAGNKTSGIGLAIDNLSISSAVPLPPTLWLIGTGLGLIGMARNSMRSKFEGTDKPTVKPV